LTHRKTWTFLKTIDFGHAGFYSLFFINQEKISAAFSAPVTLEVRECCSNPHPDGQRGNYACMYTS
jgi:hypothetical protein